MTSLLSKSKSLESLVASSSICRDGPHYFAQQYSRQVNVSQRGDSTFASSKENDRNRHQSGPIREVPLQEQLTNQIAYIQTKNKAIQKDNALILKQVREKKLIEGQMTSQVRLLKERIQYVKQRKHVQQKELNIYAMNVKPVYESNKITEQPFSSTYQSQDHIENLKQIDNLGIKFGELFSKTASRCSAQQKNHLRHEMAKIADQMKLLRVKLNDNCQ